MVHGRSYLVCAGYCESSDMLIDHEQIWQDAERERAAAYRAPATTQTKRPVVRVKKIGREGRPNPAFEELRRHRNYTPARLMDSPLVSDEVYADRMCACIACPHATVFVNGAVFCECCICRAWRKDMRALNRHAENMCRRENPAFGQWEPEDN